MLAEIWQPEQLRRSPYALWLRAIAPGLQNRRENPRSWTPDFQSVAQAQSGLLPSGRQTAWKKPLTCSALMSRPGWRFVSPTKRLKRRRAGRTPIVRSSGIHFNWLYSAQHSSPGNPLHPDRSRCLRPALVPHRRWEDRSLSGAGCFPAGAASPEGKAKLRPRTQPALVSRSFRGTPCACSPSNSFAARWASSPPVKCCVSGD